MIKLCAARPIESISSKHPARARFILGPQGELIAPIKDTLNKRSAYHNKKSKRK